MAIAQGPVPLNEALAAARRDSIVSIGLGGLITLAILSTAAVTFFGSGEGFDAFTMANQLEPLLGAAAGPVFAAGLFAGGLTSALTAPLAAGYAVCGALGWRSGLKDTPFRAVCLAVLASGTLFAALGTRPLAAILFAQAANGLLLPFVAIALLLIVNRTELLGAHRNGPLANLIGAAVVAGSAMLGLTKLLDLAGKAFVAAP
jgi:Mn2+/Fe2+ NRAMP family transporter